jgi:hypothetical protein
MLVNLLLFLTFHFNNRWKLRQATSTRVCQSSSGQSKQRTSLPSTPSFQVCFGLKRSFSSRFYCLGYTACDDDKGHDYDTMEERYQKMKKICSSFIAFQFGICTFKWDEELKKYKARPFCFYVFPRSKVGCDRTMLFQVSFLLIRFSYACV